MNSEQLLPDFKLWTQQMNEYWQAFYPMFPPIWGDPADKGKKAGPDGSDGSSMADFSNQSQAMQEMMNLFMGAFQPAFNEMFFSQIKNLANLSLANDISKTLSSDGILNGVFKSWSTVYENDIRRFLHIPQLGLTRFYQEHFNEAADRFNLFMTSAQEFSQILMSPFKESFQMLQDQLKDEKNSTDPPDAQKAYNLWIKILEENFLSLLQSDQYTCALSKTLDALEDFIDARKEVIQDTLKWCHIPAEKDMDEVYKEVYQLKKRLKALEKRKTTRGKNVSIQNTL